jgi:hypothetical protein
MYQSVNSDHNKNYKDDVISVSHLLLPVEIVETWEPVYKEEERRGHPELLKIEELQDTLTKLSVELVILKNIIIEGK